MKTLTAPLILTLSFALSQPALAATHAEQATAIAQNRAACTGEIAALFVEKSQLTAPAQASMRTLIENNLRTKIAAFENYFGQRLDPEEIKKKILENENGGQASSARAKAKEARVRSAEKTMKMDWGFEPVFTTRNFVPESTDLPNINVAAVKGQGDNFKVVYSTPSSSSKHGYHIYDLDLRKDIFFEGKLDWPAYYSSPTEEAMVTSPWLNNNEPSRVDIYDPTTGKLKVSYPLATAISGFAQRNFKGQPRLYPFQKAKGEMGIAIAYRVGAKTSLDVFELDLATGLATELASLEPDSVIYRSRDNHHIYAYSVGEYESLSQTSGRKHLTVTDVLSGQMLLNEFISVDKSGQTSLKANQLAFLESDAGQIYLGVYPGPAGADQLTFFDVFGKTKKVLPGTPDSMSGGRLVENQGKVHFIQFVRTDGQQSIIDIETGKIAVRNLGSFFALSPIGTMTTERHSAFSLYESIAPNGGGSNIEVLPLEEQLGHYKLNLGQKTATKLHSTFKNAQGQVFGVFTSEKRVKNDNQYNLHVVQLYGPPAEKK